MWRFPFVHMLHEKKCVILISPTDYFSTRRNHFFSNHVLFSFRSCLLLFSFFFFSFIFFFFRTFAFLLALFSHFFMSVDVYVSRSVQQSHRWSNMIFPPYADARTHLKTTVTDGRMDFRVIPQQEFCNFIGFYLIKRWLFFFLFSFFFFFCGHKTG